MIFLYYYYCYSSLKLVGINQSCIYRLLNHTNWRSWKHARLRAWIWFLTHNLAALIPGGKPNFFTGYQSGRTRNQICLVTLRKLFTCTKITDYIVCCLEYHWSVEIPWGERSPDKAELHCWINWKQFLLLLQAAGKLSDFAKVQTYFLPSTSLNQLWILMGDVSCWQSPRQKFNASCPGRHV